MQYGAIRTHYHVVIYGQVILPTETWVIHLPKGITPRTVQGERWGPNWADQGLGGKWSFQPITSRDYFRWRDGLNHTSTLCDLLWPNVGLLPDCCQAPLHWSFAGKVFFTWRTKKGDHKSTNMGYEWYEPRKLKFFFWVFCTTKTGIWSGWSFLYHVFVCCLNGCPGRFTYWRSGIQMLLCGKPMMRQSGKRNGKDMVRIW